MLFARSFCRRRIRSNSSALRPRATRMVAGLGAALRAAAPGVLRELARGAVAEAARAAFSGPAACAPCPDCRPAACPACPGCPAPLPCSVPAWLEAGPPWAQAAAPEPAALGAWWLWPALVLLAFLVGRWSVAAPSAARVQAVRDHVDVRGAPPGLAPAGQVRRR